MILLIYVLCGCIYYGFSYASGSTFHLMSTNSQSEKLREYSESDNKIKQSFAKFMVILTVVLKWPEILFKELTR